MKKMLAVCICAFMVLGIAGCNSNHTYQNAKAVYEELKKEESIKTKSAKNFNKDNDPNSLMGKDNQYTSKISWKDSSITLSDSDEYAGTIEFFRCKEDAKLRKDYINGVVNAINENFSSEKYGSLGSIFAKQGMIAHSKGNVLISISTAFSEEKREKYFDTFDSVLKGIEFKQSKVPSKDKIAKIKKNNKTKIETTISEMKTTFEANLDKIGNDVDTKINDAEKNKSIADLEDVESQLKDIEDIPYYSERLAAWKTRIESLKASISKEQADAAAAELASHERTFSAGEYTVGTDIPAGVYNIVAVSGHGNLFVRGYGKRLNEIMGTTDPSFYMAQYNNAELTTGQTIVIKSTLVLNFKPVS